MGRFDQLTQLGKQPSQPSVPDPKATEGGPASPVGPEATPPQRAEVPERPNGSTGERPNARTGQRENARTPERPNGARDLVRASFDLYEDQIEALRRLSLDEQLAGGPGSKAQMVREAIDAYLTKRATQK